MAVQTAEESESQTLIMVDVNKGVEEDACNMIEQRSANFIEEWKVEEAESLRTQQHLITENKEEVSAWVKQNLIKLGKLLGADFQRHEDEAMDLLPQVDNARHARHQDATTVCKKTRFKCSKELKNLVWPDTFQERKIVLREQ